MNPNEQLQKDIQRLTERVASLERRLNEMDSEGTLTPDFRKVISELIVSILGETSIDAFADVNTSGASDGNVLKYNSGTWEPGTDETE